MGRSDEPRDRLRDELRCLVALKATGLLDARRLPALATWLLAAGLETPAIVDLASLDLQPFFPVDAAELFEAAVEELELEPLGTTDRLRIALAAAARAHLEGPVGTERLLSIGSRLAVANDYPDEPEGVMHLYGLHDEWEGDWGRARNEVASDVRDVAEAAVGDSPVAQRAQGELLTLAFVDSH